MRKTAVITGASKGLGYRLALAFWDAGYNLALVSRSPVSLGEFVAGSENGETNKQRVNHYIADLADLVEIEKAVKDIKSEFKSIDVLINNAGVHGPIGALDAMAIDGWKQAMNINFFAPVFLISSLLDTFSKTGASIINISGGGAVSFRENFHAYSSSKAALQRFTENVSIELAEKGIRINSVAPGAMPTKLIKEIEEVGKQQAGSKEFAAAKDVLNTSEDRFAPVTDLCLFLADDQASHINGLLVSAKWDKWGDWRAHQEEITKHNFYKVKRFVPRDMGFDWGDK